MLCVDFSRLCMSGLSLCDLCLCYSIIGSQFSNKYLLTYLLTYSLAHLTVGPAFNSIKTKLTCVAEGGKVILWL